MSPKHDPHNPKSAFGRGFVGFWRKVYQPIGFHRGYNFPLFVILAGAMMGFVLARLQYLSINGILKAHAIPGEWFYWQDGFRRVGIILHLATILPAAFLVCFQFVPVIRHKALLFHRINGYLILLLFVPSMAGVYMMLRRTVGGDPNTQAAGGVLATSTTLAICMAYYNIKRLQIDQHRAWMLRAWVYAGSIISLRLIMMAANDAIWAMNDYDATASCAEIFSDYTTVGVPDAHNPAFKLYPQCAANPSAVVAVHAGQTGPENTGATFKLNFGMAMWVAFFLHAVGVEIYLSLTPAEKERLRMVAYEKQLEAGFKNPGKAGLTVDSFGDATEWRPQQQKQAGLEMEEQQAAGRDGVAAEN